MKCLANYNCASLQRNFQFYVVSRNFQKKQGDLNFQDYISLSIHSKIFGGEAATTVVE